MLNLTVQENTNHVANHPQSQLSPPLLPCAAQPIWKQNFWHEALGGSWTCAHQRPVCRKVLEQETRGLFKQSLTHSTIQVMH